MEQTSIELLKYLCRKIDDKTITFYNAITSDNFERSARTCNKLSRSLNTHYNFNVYMFTEKFEGKIVETFYTIEYYKTGVHLRYAACRIDSELFFNTINPPFSPQYDARLTE